MSIGSKQREEVSDSLWAGISRECLFERGFHIFRGVVDAPGRTPVELVKAFRSHGRQRSQVLPILFQISKDLSA